jgi:uncharacterized protein
MTPEILVDHEVNATNNLNHRATVFDEGHTLHELKHYLPAQASLKDFIHHNTLHAFQHMKFFEGTRAASEMLGYRVSLSLKEFRKLHADGKIGNDILEKIIIKHKGKNFLESWKKKALHDHFDTPPHPRIGALRSNWKRIFQMDLDSLVHPLLFRVLCGYLDQGIAIWNFPVWHKDFFGSIQDMERLSFTSFFRGNRAKKLIIESPCSINDLLKILVGDESLYEQYLFDQQFAHQGWSGMVSVVETQPETLLDKRNITLRDLIRFELLLEIDALDSHFPKGWSPLGSALTEKPVSLFEPLHSNTQKNERSDLNEVIIIWQEAFEWTYYDDVLSGIQSLKGKETTTSQKTFQAMFCIDDRECSLRRHLEKVDPNCGTYGTPGFFSAEFFFQPLDGKFYTKVCPAPITPKYLIKEIGIADKRGTDLHFQKHTHTLFRGWLISQTLGFVAAFKLLFNIFRPTMSPATATSFKHMDKKARLTIENQNPNDCENGLQVGFTIPEMVQRTEGLLKSIGLVKDFAPIVYVIGHGSSSVNNPHFAAYDCGACSGRPGSANSRVLCYMANHLEVRRQLAERGIVIPAETEFIGGLHDTTRDDLQFFDKDTLSPKNPKLHQINKEVFTQALNANAKERSRRFMSINSHHKPAQIHEEVKVRSVSLFEPRPELNHATNALCIVGRRSLTKGLFLDRRAFLNSYDYRIDPQGKYLLNILKPAAPVCGGINLEYYFSRVDNRKLGAGTKLPHNVMGLIGVANGIDGDLRPGLPSQMIEVHDPVRLLMIVEHFPEVVLETIKRSPETYEWFINEWINLVVVNPETYETCVFAEGEFHPYETLGHKPQVASDFTPLFEEIQDNMPVMAIQ